MAGLFRFGGRGSGLDWISNPPYAEATTRWQRFCIGPVCGSARAGTDFGTSFGVDLSFPFGRRGHAPRHQDDWRRHNQVRHQWHRPGGGHRR